LEDRYNYYQRVRDFTVEPLLGANQNTTNWQSWFDTIPAILPNFYDDEYVWNTNLYSDLQNPTYTNVTNLQKLIFLGNYQWLQAGGNPANMTPENIPIKQLTFFDLDFTMANGTRVDFKNSPLFNPIGLIQKPLPIPGFVDRGDVYYSVLKTIPNTTVAVPITQGMIVGTFDPRIPINFGYRNIIPINSVKVGGKSTSFRGAYKPSIPANPPAIAAPSESWGLNGLDFGDKLWDQPNLSGQTPPYINRVNLFMPYSGGG
jgi:hypothetical protein